jgi:Leucine-rich repeat (LRR) protein
LQNDPAAAPEDIHIIRETLARGAGPSAIPNPQSAIEATLDSTFMGTPQFMSPEQARGEIGTLRCAQRRQCSDLSFLAESPALVSLDCNTNSIADLHPPAGLPLTELMIRNNPIADYAMLLELRQLQKLLISELSQIKVSLEPLRQQPSLQYIAFDSNGRYRPMAEFWADYDAQQE